MRRKLSLSLLCVLSCTALSFAQSTSTTRLIPYSGAAMDASGRPMSGPVTLTLELFEEMEGGEALWSETQDVQTDDRGRYTVYLGALNRLPQIAFSEERARWLGITIGGRALPRVALVAVPYALRAADADTLGGQPAASFVRKRSDGRLETSAGIVVSEPAIEGSGIAGQIAKFTSATTVGPSVISESASNRVGFGLVDPTGGGVVDSVFTIRNFDNNTGFGILNESQQRRFAINTLAGGGWAMYDGGGGVWNLGLNQTSGRVRLGTMTPFGSEKLTVQAAATRGVWVRSTSDFALIGDTAEPGDTGGTAVLGEAGTGRGVWAFSSSGFGLYVSGGGSVQAAFVGSGDVGIGTATPLEKLHVVGDIRIGTGTTGCVRDADATIIAGVCSSDLRFKKNITPFGRALEKVAALQPVNFHWRADEYYDKHFGTGQTFGLIAQDVERVLPELVTTDEQGFRAVRYNALPMHMLQAIKDLKAENDELKQQLEQQNERLRRLEALLGSQK